MKKIFLFLMIYFSFFQVTWGKEYKNLQYGFSIRIPKAWRILESEKDVEEWKKEVAEIAPGLDKSFQYADGMIILVGPVEDGDLSEILIMIKKGSLAIDERGHQEFMKGMESALKSPENAASHPKILSSQIIDFKGVSAIEVKSTRTLLGVDLYQWQFVVPGKEHLFFLNIGLPMSKLKEKEGELRKIVYTFKGAHQAPLSFRRPSSSGKDPESLAYNIGRIIGVLFWIILIGYIFTRKKTG